MSVGLLGGLLLAVSLISVMIYAAALGQILVGEHRPGLVRTAICRIAAALLYVWVGLATVHEHVQGPLLGLGIFTAVQLMWQINSVADVRMTRKARKSVMTDPMYDTGLTTPVSPNIPLMSNVVVTSEIDRLSKEQGTIKQDVGKLRTDVDTGINARRYGVSAFIFTTLVAVAGLIFGLIVFNRADDAQALAHQNAAIIAQQRDTIAQLKATQVRLDLTVHEFCGLYGSFIGFYSLRSRALFTEGPTAYDNEYRNLVRSADRLQCGIKPPPDLSGI
jgi:cell division protein FtsB